MSYRQDDQRARRGWRGPRVRYDLIKEGLIALTVVALLTIGLSAVFGSPKVEAISFQSWAKAAPDDFVSTTLAELTGTSGSATYGPPYTGATENVQSIGPFSPQTWLGVTTPVDSSEDLVIAPLSAWAPFDARLQQAVERWTAATAEQQTAWGAVALGSDISIDGTTVTLTPTPDSSATPDASPAPSRSVARSADAGPIPAMLSAMLTGARSGALDSQSVNGPDRQYATDYTKSLLYIADGTYAASVAESYNLLGDQWGVMNQGVPLHDLPMPRHLLALVPGERQAQMPGQVAEGRDDGIADRRRVVLPVGQVPEPGAAGGALHERDDRRPVRGAHDQVALPVTGLLAVEHRRGTLVDQGHAGDRTRASGLGMTAWQTMAASEAQHPPGQLTRQTAQVGAVDRLIDGLGAEPAPGLVGVSGPQLAGDLLGTPACLQPAAHPLAQLGIEGQPAWPMEPPTREGALLRLERPIATRRVGAAGELATDGRRRPAHAGGDLAHRASLTTEVGEADALVLGEVAR